MKGFLPPPIPGDASDLPPGRVSSADIMVMIQLDPQSIFDTFVISPTNRLVFAAARCSPGTSYNPLFICAVSGF